MLGNYLKTAWRHLLKNNLFSIINIFGLAVGMAACLVIYQYVRFELSYDIFHRNKDHLYRVLLNDYHDGKFIGKSAATVSGLGQAIDEAFPKETVFARISRQQKTIVTYHDGERDPVKFIEDRILHADPSFLEIFSFPLLKGDKSSALSTPRTLVLSTSSARKYFKEADPVGKLLSVGEGEPYLVQGVFEDIPENSHLKFDFLLSFATLGQHRNEDWSWQDAYTYLLLPAGVSTPGPESQLTQIVKQYHHEGSKDTYHLQALADIHLDDSLSSDIAETNSAKLVYFLMAIGVVLMVIALVNFINLTTAKHLERMHEIGVRKVMGASGPQLVRQFLVESALLNGLALLFAIGIVLVAVPIFEQWGLAWFPVLPLRQGWFWAFLGGLLLVNIVIAGLYPVFAISFFPARQAVKMKSQPTIRNMSFTRFLIVFQFTASLVLLTGVFIIYQQLQFMKEQELAIDISQILVVQEPHLTDRTTASKFETFKKELNKYPAVRNVTHSSSVPGEPIDWKRNDIRLRNQNTERFYPSKIIAVGADFVKTYNLKILAGRDFQQEMATDAQAMLINEAAARQFEFNAPEDALEKRVFMGNREFRIIGVVNDYHHLSIKEAIHPTLYFVGDPRRPIYSIKIGIDDLPSSIATIRSIWEKVYPDNVFAYFFLHEFYDEQYRSDQQFGTATGLFTVLALLIACLGLFGFAAYTTVQRTKEIGIRKVLGASVTSILILLSRQYLQLIVIALLIATPIVNYLIAEWLQNFARRIEVQWWMLALPGALLLLITLISVAGQTWKTTGTNPVDSLRHE